MSGADGVSGVRSIGSVVGVADENDSNKLDLQRRDLLKLKVAIRIYHCFWKKRLKT